jgi:hypothetical protein
MSDRNKYAIKVRKDNLRGYVVRWDEERFEYTFAPQSVKIPEGTQVVMSFWHGGDKENQERLEIPVATVKSASDDGEGLFIQATYLPDETITETNLKIIVKQGIREGRLQFLVRSEGAPEFASDDSSRIVAFDVFDIVLMEV